MMGDNRQLRIDKMELWRVEVNEKLNTAIESAMRNAQEAEKGLVEVTFSQKVNTAGEGNVEQTVAISQFTTAEDITQDLVDKIAEGMCVSSTIRVVEDSLMEGTQEIAAEREREEEVVMKRITWSSMVEDFEQDVEEEIEAELRAEERQERERQEETEKWERAMDFTLALPEKERSKGMSRRCYRRIGTVVFDVAGEFVDWVLRRLIWTKEELERDAGREEGEKEEGEKEEIERLKKKVKALNRVLSTTVRALDTIMEAQWDDDSQAKKKWEKTYLRGESKVCNEAHEAVAMENRMKLDKRHRDMEEKCKETADMTRQIHAHLGLGNLRDEAALAQRKAAVIKENKKIITEEQKRKDLKALEAERKVQEQKMTWAQRASGGDKFKTQVTTSMTLDGATPETTSISPPLKGRKETKIVMEVKVAYPGPGTAWVGMKERLRGEITAAFQAFNNASPDLRLPAIKDVGHTEGYPYERLLTFEGSAESAEAKKVLQDLIAYFTAQDRDYFKRAWEHQPWATSLVVYGLPARDFHSIKELDIKLRMENKELRWGERKARRLVGKAAEHGKPPLRVEFESAAEAKKAMMTLRLGGNLLTVKKYYDRAAKVEVPGAPTGPKIEVLSIQGNLVVRR